MKKNNIIIIAAAAAITCAVTAVSVYGAVTANNVTEYIGDVKAVEIAQADVKAIESGEQTVIKNKFEIDDGYAEYDIDIVVGTTKYEYEINALTGAIKSREIEKTKVKTEITKQAKAPAQTNTTSAPAVYIGEVKATEIVQADIKLTDANEQTVVKAKLDYDDGRAEYDVTVKAGDKKYEYEIDAVTGEIIGREFDLIKTKTTAKTTTTKPATTKTTETASKKAPVDTSAYIGEEKAQAIILEFAKISADTATFTKCKLDREDGIYVYEIEFYANGYEYEAEINATTGEVVDYEIDD